MDRKSPNPIQKARICKGWTQERLAEECGYSDDSIRAWETGARVATLEALDILQKTLKAPWLAAAYLREQSPSLAAVVPEFEPNRPIAEAAAAYIGCCMQWTSGHFDANLLKMIADGRIDEAEQEDWLEVMDLANRLQKSYLELRFADTEKKAKG